MGVFSSNNKCLLIFLSLLSFHGVILGQSFRPGKVFLLNGESTQGLIQYREKNFETCVFKSDSGVLVQYQPKDILAFEVDGHRIEAYLINEEQKFIEVLVKGKISLLNDGNVFYAAKEGEVYKLIHERKDEVINGIQRQVVSKRYLGILTMLFPGCAIELKKAERMSFSEKNLVDMMKELLVCAGLEYTVYYKNERLIDINPVLQFANNNTFYHFDTPQSLNSHLQKNLTDNSWSFSVGLDIKQPKLSEKISLRLESWYNTNTYNLTAPSERISYDIRQLDFNWDEITAVLGLQYRTFEKNTPYVIVHWNSSFLMNTSIVQTYRNLDSGESEASEPFDFKKTYFGPGASLGYSYSISMETKLFVECRYVYGYGVLKETPAATSNNHSLKFSCGFIF